MTDLSILARGFAVVLSALLFIGGDVSAQEGPDTGAERPVYLDILPVAGAENSVLADDVVASMARESLSGAGLAVIRMSNQSLPVNVRVLRIMYIVHEQSEENGSTLAASASTELLRTSHDGDGDGVNQTYSIYNGLQQTLVQGSDLARAREQLRDAFRHELQARIASAFDSTTTP